MSFQKLSWKWTCLYCELYSCPQLGSESGVMSQRIGGSNMRFLDNTNHASQLARRGKWPHGTRIIYFLCKMIKVVSCHSASASVGVIWDFLIIPMQISIGASNMRFLWGVIWDFLIIPMQCLIAALPMYTVSHVSHEYKSTIKQFL